MTLIRAVISKLEQAMLWLACVSCILLILCAVIDIVGRHFGLRFSFLNEIGIYLSAVVFFLPLADVTRRAMHIRADFFDGLIASPRIRAWIRLLVIDTSFLLYGITLLWFCTGLAIDSFSFGTRSASQLMVPVAWPQTVMVIGLGLLAIRILLELLDDITAIRLGIERTVGHGDATSGSSLI